MRKPGGCVRYIRDTQNVRCSESCSKSVNKYAREEKEEDCVYKRSINCEQTVFREETESEQATYKSKIEEESGCVENSFRKLMKMRTKTTETRCTSGCSPEPDHFEDLEEKYVSNMRTATGDDVLWPGFEMDTSESGRLSTSGVNHTSYGKAAAT